MTEFNFTQSERAYEKRFFQFPQVLLYGKKYKNLSDSAKLGYMILQDRFDYSLQNNWIDEENRVYFIFTNQELHEIFGWNDRKINRVKKELEEAGLLFQIKQGFDPKKKRNLPNKLYLADLEVTATDVYTKHNFSNKTVESLATSGTDKMTARQEKNKSAESLATSGTDKMTARQKKAESLATSGTDKMQDNLYNTNSLDTNRYNIDTAELDFSTENYSKAEIQKQNQDLIEQAYKFLTNDEAGIPFEPETVKLISLWTNNPKQVRKFIGIILNARKAVQEEHNISFILDDEPELQAKITQTIRRYFNALRSDDKKIRNQENYLYITMKNMFENYGSARQQQEYRAEHPTKKDREEAFINGLKGGLPESIRNAENYK
ncbi:replication initiator protein A (plasmid) [Ligilactobacillus acidipiscis]|uniref:replication initiator protein A n=1 Tax=Ligilactobacillus acidipiscis TaxID=89059 RepID=UPI0038663F31